MNISRLFAPLSAPQIDSLAAVFEASFGRPPAEDFAGRVNEKKGLLVLVAETDQVVGFKIGYERFRGVFFSWLGAVDPRFQRRGIARKLAEAPHDCCLERQYTEIQTETFSDGNAMLLLNLKMGFEIYGTHLGSDGRLRVELRNFLKK